MILLLRIALAAAYPPLAHWASHRGDGAAAGLDVSAHLMLMGALLLFAMTFSLWPVAAALRVALE